jgi:hypothetical protein
VPKKEFAPPVVLEYPLLIPTKELKSPIVFEYPALLPMAILIEVDVLNNAESPMAIM